MNNSAQRQGTVLLVVIGLCGVLLTTFLVILHQIRSEASQADDVVADAQSRVMLSAALSFICEGARLGNNVNGETFGWTDIRTGAVGPLTYNQTNITTTDGNLPGQSESWPNPGSRYRADMYVWEQPPLAVKPIAAPNPVQAPREWLLEFENSPTPKTTTLGTILHASQTNHGTGFGYFPEDNSWKIASSNKMEVLDRDAFRKHWGTVWAEVIKPIAANEPGYHRLLELQPEADTVTEFTTGKRSGGRPSVRADSQNRAWFRLYRETPADHDGDGAPYYDNMPLTGHGVFIVTCGAGGTQGYADWSEVVAAGKTSQFIDQATFELLQSQEKRIWYRVQWGGFTGGAGDLIKRYTTGSPTMTSHGSLGSGLAKDGTPQGLHATALATQTPYYTAPWVRRQAWGSRSTTHLAHITHAPVTLNASGTIRWIERLPREPDNW